MTRSTADLPLFAYAARRAEDEARARAEAALARRRERAQAKALALTIALEDQEKRTAARLREQKALLARLRTDPRLDALLTARRAGRPITEALAAAERMPPRAAEPGAAAPPGPYPFPSPRRARTG